MVQEQGRADPPARARWACCLPTADETTVSLSCPAQDTGPWLAELVIKALQAEPGVIRDPGRGRSAVGARGAPLIQGEPLRWGGTEALLEVVCPADSPLAEVCLRLPPWEHLSRSLAEDDLWEGIDRVAAELGARLGAVDDGPSVGFPAGSPGGGIARSLWRHHLGLILPPTWLSHLPGGTDPYRELPGCGLVVVLH